MERYEKIFKTRRKIMEKAENVKEKAKFIYENAEYLKYGYMLDDAYDSIVSKKLTEKFGIFVGASKGQVEIDSIGFRSSYSTYAEIESLVSKAMSASPISKDDLDIKENMRYSTKNFDYESIGKFKKYSSGDITTLIQILYFAVTGKSKNSWQEAIKILATPENEELKDVWGYGGKGVIKNHKIKELRNLSITIFRNNKIGIKGLTPEQDERILHLFEIIK